jgi:cytochrome c
VTLRWIVLAGALCVGPVAPAAAAADAQRGEQIYARCLACHALAYDRVGPRHCGLFGRRAGSVPGFDYSPAMKTSNITWNERSLARFLAKPLAVVPGTTMTYDGVADARDRSDLIAYLKSASESGDCAK